MNERDPVEHPVLVDPVAAALLEFAQTSRDLELRPERILNALIAGWDRGLRPVRAAVDAGIPYRFVERAAWHRQGYRSVELVIERIPVHLFERFPFALARQLRAVPVEDSERSVVVAVADPTDYISLDDIRRRFHPRPVEFVVSDSARIVEMIDEIDLRSRTETIEITEEEQAFNAFVSLDVEDDSEGRVAQLVKNLIMRAAASRASDIHIEPSERGVTVRFRIDGVLHHVSTHPLGLGQGIVNRLKVMANLDVSERRVPQDGRFGIRISERSLDIRLVTVPTVWEVEESVMRLLDQTRQVNDLGGLGYSRQVLDVYQELAHHPHGMLLATGPTGSGKTTALYATLKQIATIDRKVLTIEDPVEYRMSGITQVQVNPKAGLTFARALRSFLRADPDIMLVGEVRDRETGFTAVEAALTGHLVLASLHANSAPSAATRLIEMQIEPFLIASSLRGVISQRLVRVLCESCKLETPTPAGVFARIEHRVEIPSSIFQASEDGCGFCSGTGFRGRMAIAEVMATNHDITRAIAENRPELEIERLAVEGGMVPLYEDGLVKVLAGLTTPAEVGRVAN